MPTPFVVPFGGVFLLIFIVYLIMVFCLCYRNMQRIFEYVKWSEEDIKLSKELNTSIKNLCDVKRNF